MVMLFTQDGWNSLPEPYRLLHWFSLDLDNLASSGTFGPEDPRLVLLLHYESPTNDGTKLYFRSDKGSCTVT